MRRCFRWIRMSVAAAVLGVFSGPAVAQESERPMPPADGDYQWVSTYRLEDLNRRIECPGDHDC